MKYPHLQFYTGDWLKDPKLSMCSPATRGVWIDLLCAMHELDRTGELRGTTEELARLARCSTVELESALTDLQTKRAAGVEQRNGSWSVANNRMQREHLTRLKRQQAGSKGGSQAQASREGKPYDNDNDIDIGLGRVMEFCVLIQVGMKDAEWFFYKCEANGWTNRGEPIRDWKATIRSWKNAGYLPSQKAIKNGNGFFNHDQKKPAPTGEAYQPRPPSREPTEEELETQRRIVREASESFHREQAR